MLPLIWVILMMDTAIPLTDNRKTCLIIHHVTLSLMDSLLTGSHLMDNHLTDSSLMDNPLMDSSLMDNPLMDSHLMDSSLTATVQTGRNQATTLLPTNYPKTCLSKN